MDKSQLKTSCGLKKDLKLYLLLFILMVAEFQKFLGEFSFIYIEFNASQVCHVV